MAIPNGAGTGSPRTVLDTARQTMGDYDPEAVAEMDETQMAQAIGRLTATLGMLIATVEQPT